MDRDRQLVLVRRFYDEMWNRFDTSVLDQLLEPDVRFRGSLGQEKVGHEEFGEYVEFIRAFAPDFHNRVDQTVSEGDTTFARLTYTGTHRGEVFGRSPTGRRFSYAGAAVFAFSDRLIASVWVLGDIHGLLRQLDGDDRTAP